MLALHEWGATKHDARRLFENLVLEGAQASLGWMTILSKREKINSAIENAISLFNIPEIFGSCDAQIWGLRPA